MPKSSLATVKGQERPEEWRYTKQLPRLKTMKGKIGLNHIPEKLKKLHQTEIGLLCPA